MQYLLSLLQKVNNTLIENAKDFHVMTQMYCLLEYISNCIKTSEAYIDMQPCKLQFLNQTRSNSFIFKHQEYLFLQVFKNYTDQKFHNFYRQYYNFWTIYDDIHNCIGEINHFALDLLKKSDTKP